MISDETAASAFSNKAVVTAVDYPNRQCTVAYYEATQAAYANASTMSIFVYGSEFRKGTDTMADTLISDDSIFSNSPIILKDTYRIAGSDMAQIG